MPAAEDKDATLSRGIRVTVLNNASAFSYSVLVTAVFGAATMVTGAVSALRLVLFAVGATVGFTATEVAASRGFHVRIREEPTDVVVVGTALPVAVVAGLGAALALLYVLPNTLGWLLAPTVATLVYIVLAGFHMMLARRYEEKHPPDEQG